jgi:hypothetical protein
MAEHEKDFETIEETTEEVVVEEKPNIFAPVCDFASGCFEKAKGGIKWIAVALAGVAAGAIATCAYEAHQEQKQTREALADQGLTIEDVPELGLQNEAEYGPYAEA